MEQLDNNKKICLTEHTICKVEEIHKMSVECNRHKNISHSQILLDMMRHHIEEIEELLKDNNSHYLIETGDLIVLCMELLLDNNVDLNDILNTCFQRFKKKLSNLTNQQG